MAQQTVTCKAGASLFCLCMWIPHSYLIWSQMSVARLQGLFTQLLQVFFNLMFGIAVLSTLWCFRLLYRFVHKDIIVSQNMYHYLQQCSTTFFHLWHTLIHQRRDGTPQYFALQQGGKKLYIAISMYLHVHPCFIRTQAQGNKMEDLLCKNYQWWWWNNASVFYEF